MKNYSLFLTLTLCLFSAGWLEAQENQKYGIVFGPGVNTLVNHDVAKYYRTLYGFSYNMVFYYQSNLKDSNRKLRFELELKDNTNAIRFNATTNGIVHQTKVGVNTTLSLFAKNADERDDFFLGLGLYTLAQQRFPDPVSELKMIDDGFGAYYGISIITGYNYLIKDEHNKLGVTLRFVYNPNLTFGNKDDSPEYYSFGSFIGLIYIFR